MNRPTHPDMDLMEKVLQGQDAAAERQEPLGDMQPIDPEVVMWCAAQRTMRADRLGLAHEPRTVRAAIWLDGFAAGADAARRKALEAR